jgi:hypothetical protein
MRDVFDNLCHQECVKRGLVVPDFGVKLMSMSAQCHLGQLKPLIRPNLDSSPQGKQGLQQSESEQKNSHAGHRLAPAPVSIQGRF